MADVNESTAESEKIRFGDYFSVCMPGYKRLSELKRNEAVYLPSNYLLPSKIYSYINNERCKQIPKELIDEVLVVEMQKFDKMIDVNGCLFDWSSESSIYSPMEIEDYQVDWFTKKISAINNVLFGDCIDIEASIIYNLIEIRPRTTQISLDYLRYYFWDKVFCCGDTGCNDCEFNTSEKCTKMPMGIRALNCACDISHLLIFKESGEERFLISSEILTDLEIEVDDISKRDSLVELHNQYLSEQSRAFGKKYLQERFGSPLYDSLQELEAKTYSVLTHIEKKTAREKYTGFVRTLEEAMTIFNSIKANSPDNLLSISQSSMMAFEASCEIILNAKLRLLGAKNWNASNGFNDNINFIFSNERACFNRRLSTIEWNEFRHHLDDIRKMKNKGSHTSEFISIDEAEKMINEACNKVIRGIIEYIR